MEAPVGAAGLAGCLFLRCAIIFRWAAASGQHFLTRKSILDRIADAACDPNTPLVIEVGPGKGSLTECLLARATKLIAIEVDTYLVHYLRQKFATEIDEGRLTLIEGDILKTDLTQWGKAVVAGNLPYYITSPILEKLFSMGDTWTRAVFLMQVEVAERLAANSRHTGFRLPQRPDPALFRESRKSCSQWRAQPSARPPKWIAP